MQLQCNKTFIGHSAAVYDLLPYNYTSFISAGSDGIIAKWDFNNSEKAMALAVLGQPIFCLCYVNAIEQLWVGSAAGNIHILDLEQSKEIRNIELLSSGIFKMEVIGEYIWVLSGNGHAFIFDFEANLVKDLDLSESKLRSILMWKDSILIGDSGGQIFELDKSTWELKSKFIAHNPSVYAMCSDADFLYTSGRDGHIRKWNLLKELVWEIPAHNYAIYSLCMWNGHLVSSSRDKKLKIWNDRGEFLGKTIPEIVSRGSVNKSIIWRDGILTASDDGKIRFFLEKEADV